MQARSFFIRCAVCALAAGLPAQAQNRAPAEHWVVSWAASPQQPRAVPPPAAGQPAPPARPGQRFENQTIRMTVRASMGGPRVRVRLSNAFGTAPLMIGSAQVALHAKESEIVPGSGRVLTFSGRPAAAIPAGAEIISDPVDLAVPALGDLAISVFVPGDTGAPTTHGTGLHTTYISKEGNFTAAPSIADASTTASWYFLSGVEVPAAANAAVIVAYGDSITDGATSTVDTNSSWPGFLAARLAAAGARNIAVVNEGISGNRVLRDNTGVNALARFDRDVLSQEGVKWLMVMEGINDIGQGTRANADPANAVTLDDLIAAHKQLIERAHLHGIKVIGCTLTPYQGAAYFSDAGEVIREGLNQWIKTGGAYDAVADFDAATQDPANPKQLRKDYNIMDHLHPNDAGYKAMAEAIDLSVFGVKKR